VVSASEFVNLKGEDVFFEEQRIFIAKAKGGKSHYVPILPELAQELGGENHSCIASLIMAIAT